MLDHGSVYAVKKMKVNLVLAGSVGRINLVRDSGDGTRYSLLVARATILKASLKTILHEMVKPMNF
ncbi:MAG: hypothetical protein ACI9XC_002113 [Gammaproteobacteria bacterium]